MAPPTTGSLAATPRRDRLMTFLAGNQAPTPRLNLVIAQLSPVLGVQTHPAGSHVVCSLNESCPATAVGLSALGGRQADPERIACHHIA